MNFVRTSNDAALLPEAELPFHFQPVRSGPSGLMPANGEEAIHFTAAGLIAKSFVQIYNYSA